MKKYLLIVALFVSGAVYGQKVIDKIEIIVGNEIIMKSEIDMQSMYYAYQMGLNPTDSQIRKKVVGKMIEDRLIYTQAQLDSIVVTDDEVNKQLDFQIQTFIKQAGSKERVEQLYKMSIEKIKRELRTNIKRNIMAQKVKDKKFGTKDISRREVEEFYESYKDSLPTIPEKYKISHIFVNPKSRDDIKGNIKKFAKIVLDSLKKGVPFEDLAKRYSDHKESAANGGNLGYIARGGFLPEFESEAFRMEPGQISEVFESSAGFHIIRLNDKKGEKVNVSQILFRIKMDKKSDSLTISYLKNIKDSILSKNNTFEYYAGKYSEDKESNKFGGSLGTFDANQLDKDMVQILKGMKNNEISEPRKLNIQNDKYGYHIVKLLDIIKEHKPDIAKDFDEIKEIAQMKFEQAQMDKWINELKSKIYFEVKEN